jgi:DNA-binding NtrC family response regulator
MGKQHTSDATPVPDRAARTWSSHVTEGGEAEAAPADRAPTVGGHATVLLVEDDPSVRRVAGRFLALGGYTVLSAEDVHDAMRIARDHASPIHLLLTDIVMPGLNGPDLAQRIVGWRPTVRVLYVSGYSDTLGQPFLDGRVRLLRKPFSMRDLLAAVRQSLDAR